MANKNYENIKKVIRTMYDYQKLRIAIYNRIVSKDYLEEIINSEEFLATNKLPKSDKEKALIRKQTIDNMIKWYKENEDRIDDARTMKQRIKNLEKSDDSPIKDYYTWALVRSFIRLSDEEENVKKIITQQVKDIPIYEQYLKNVTGCGPVLSAIIISELDIHQAKHVSSFWKYAGLDVVIGEDGKGVARNNHAEHLVEREYIKQDGTKGIKKGTSYNPEFRSKLLGVLGDSFKMHKGKYRDIYDDAKIRYTEKAKISGATKMHVERQAIRYAVKMFLKELWNTWRELEGYPTEGDWYEDKVLGRRHGQNFEQTKLELDTEGNIVPDGIMSNLEI